MIMPEYPGDGLGRLGVGYVLLQKLESYHVTFKGLVQLSWNCN
jgi:hypothetical protein